jgi:hypothetical protein
MQKRRLVTDTVVGMAALLMWLSPMSSLGSDHPSSTEKQATPPAETAAKTKTDANDQITVLKQQMALQQQQIEQLQKALEGQKRLLEQLVKPATATQQAVLPQSPNLGQVASTSPIIPRTAEKSAPGSEGNRVASGLIPSAAARVATPAPPPKEGDETSPLQFHIGNAYITPVGFMDFTSIWRNHDTNGSIGTNLGNIPYTSTGAYQPNLSELRLSSENSRIGLRVDALVKGAHLLGYMEADFHGYNVSNASIVTNSNTLRERVYWVNISKGKFEVLGGQTWSLLTPGRKGISGIPGDIFYSSDIDLNYQLGLFFGRIPELRFVYHPTKQVAFAVALDSPDQYAGGYGGSTTITLPTALGTSATYQGELDYGSGNTFSSPNVAPDIIAKLAVDPNKLVHFEIGGIERNFRVYNPSNMTHYSATGAGGFLNLHVEVAKGLRLLTNNFWSSGGGRYIYGEAPDVIARADGSLSPIRSMSTVTGFEYTRGKIQLYGYYGGVYIYRNTALDANGTSLIGWGYHGSPNSQNRSLQEPTFGFNQTIWKDAKWGAVNFMGQYSYLTRNPWYVAASAPSNANIHMVWFNLRYSLPGSAPTLGK